MPAHDEKIEGLFQEENVRFNDKEAEGNGKVGVERSSREGELRRINVGCWASIYIIQ